MVFNPYMGPCADVCDGAVSGGELTESSSNDTDRNSLRWGGDEC